jgi:hypothetical protein
MNSYLALNMTVGFIKFLTWISILFSKLRSAFKEGLLFLIKEEPENEMDPLHKYGVHFGNDHKSRFLDSIK